MRSVSQRDRRAREVRLSSAGEDVLTAAVPVVTDLQRQILEGLGANERETFLQLVRKAVEAGSDEGSCP